jgi:hypothetical protein
MSSRRSQRMRRRFMPWYWAIVRSTTQRTVPGPEPWGSSRRAIRVAISLARRSLRYLSWS